ncbi:hypothetical protein BpHYR1_048870 [Brachionus plicatilis]|uniref:Uncharacterized protein n=1 Tax=Brachionus plicatilis TaxID=10195 RepID=A0A3M7Q8X9_BRAPC|nr:hypothetical protein BpHYR1_048870 [Brachionus plicatilis]
MLLSKKDLYTRVPIVLMEAVLRPSMSITSSVTPNMPKSKFNSDSGKSNMYGLDARTSSLRRSAHLADRDQSLWRVL